MLMVVQVDQKIIDETATALRKFGKQGYEGLVLWIGEYTEAKSVVIHAIVPPQTPIKSESGVGYLVSGETLFELNKILHSTGLRLISQVHSHPGKAYHSEMDDRYAIVTKDGFFSVVVPNFGAGNPNLGCWAIYQLKGGLWIEVGDQERRNLFNVVGAESTIPLTTMKQRWWEVW